MPQQKQPPNLLSSALKGVTILVTKEAIRVAKVAVTKFIFDEIEAEENGEDVEEKHSQTAWEREIYLSDQIELFKQHVITYISCNILEEAMLSILEGIENAVIIKKKQWTPTTSLTKFTREMYAIVKFANLLVLPSRRQLELTQIPKIIRTKLYGELPKFSGLRKLGLGSGSGGWVTEAYSESFLMAIPRMTHLVDFSLKYDCTTNLLQVLSESCAGTLKRLDIERSKQLSDEAAKYLIALSKLENINIFQANFTVQAQAKILTELKYLRHLDRGDFLADVVEYLCENGNSSESLQLNIEEFWASEEYYFHTEEQMRDTAFHCPKIRKILFMFRETVSSLSVIGRFEMLQDLELWGGKFCEDQLDVLLTFIGEKLNKLSLVHTEEMDESSLAHISVYCNNLHHLGIHNCEFIERIERNDLSFGQVDRFLQLEEMRQIRSLMRPMLDLKSLKIVCQCSPEHIILLLEQCLNLRELFFGMNTGFSDSVIEQVLVRNRLQKLEKVTIQKCKNMSMYGVQLLLSHCDQLRGLKDLSYCDKISEPELKEFRRIIKQENLDLDTGEEDEVEALENQRWKGGDFMKKAIEATIEDEYQRQEYLTWND